MALPPAIEIHDLVKIYRHGTPGALRALDGLTLEVRRGEIFGLLGPNGAGKSTLIKILTTLVSASSGRASIMGHDVAAHPLRVRQNICVVLQQNAVEQFLSVQDNLRTYARFQRVPQARVEERMNRLMDLFGLREERHNKVIDLSGGLKRRVQVAKVFMVDAPVIFLDEATTGMDPISKRATLEAVAEEARLGRTVFLTTHILDEAEQLCDTMMFIDRGRKLVEGDLFSIKALARKIFEISITFEALTDDIRRGAEALPHRHLKFVGATVVTSIDTAIVTPHDAVTALSNLGPVLNYEVRGATLEDIFVQLLGGDLRGA